MVTMLIPIEGVPMVLPGNDLAALLIEAIDKQKVGVKSGDVLVVCQKVVSRAEGRVRKLSEVEPSAEALEFANMHDKDPAVVELALLEASEILRKKDGHLITRTGPGFVAANSGVDCSNQAAEGDATLLPEDSDKSALGLMSRLAAHYQAQVGVIISDTFGRAWRLGQIDLAIGCAGLLPIDDREGGRDWAGRALEHTSLAVADQLAAAAGIAMKKDAGVPAVLVRGSGAELGDGSAIELLRPPEDDLFT
jgi:coenzyme F420-0:L-glutamate ligase/coenzyme F420-1:gamma-L-glutamate ligase